MTTTSNTRPTETAARRRSSATVLRTSPAPQEVGEVPPAPLWRLVGDALPDAGLSVLICQEGDQDSIQIGCCHEREEWTSVFGDAVATPTHWADLPEVAMEGRAAR